MQCMHRNMYYTRVDVCVITVDQNYRVQPYTNYKFKLVTDICIYPFYTLASLLNIYNDTIQ